MKNTSLASGDKAKISTDRRRFNSGASAGVVGKATMRHQPEAKYPGSSQRPLNKGAKHKHYHAQAVPKIPKSSQMGSGK